MEGSEYSGSTICIFKILSLLITLAVLRGNGLEEGKKGDKEPDH